MVKKLTKSDVSDIALLFMGVKFLLDFIRWTLALSISIVQGFWSTYQGDAIMKVVTLIAFGVVVYLLLFRRSFLIRRLFSDGMEAEVEVSEGLLVLTAYAFWIRLFGIITFLSSGVALVGEAAWELAREMPFDFTSYAWVRAGMDLTSLVLSFLIIRHAEWIAEKLERFGRSKSGQC